MFKFVIDCLFKFDDFISCCIVDFVVVDGDLFGFMNVFGCIKVGFVCGKVNYIVFCGF